MISFIGEHRRMACRIVTGMARNLLGVARWAGLAALFSVYADVTAQENYGRLFFNAEERRSLDDMRNDDIEPAQQVEKGEQAVVAPVVDVISYNGKVERSGGGGSTIWVNGRPVLTGNRTVEGISVYSNRGTNGETRFVLPPSDTAETDFSLKAGQKIAVQSGKVLESYESRAAEDAESVFAKELPGAEGTPLNAKPGPDEGSQRAVESAPGVPKPRVSN